MKKNIFLSLILLAPALIFAQGLPLFDYPQEEQTVTGTPNTSPFGPGGNLEGLEEQISVDVSVTNPQPGQAFNISVTSYSTNLNAARVSWYTNSSLLVSGIGETVASFVSPQAGESLVIDLIIETQEGNTIEKSFEIAPALVDLIYETQTYTPPFYKGKAVYTHQSTAIIHALPKIIEEGERKRDDDLIYTWEVNGSVQQDSSGYGKNILYFNTGILSTTSDITVTVESATSNQIAINSLVLEPHDSEILLVQEHPLYGLMDNSTNGTISTGSNDVIVHAIPLFFNTFLRDTSLINYIWTVNGSALGEDNNSSIIAFQTPPGESGSADVSIRAEHTRDFLQGATNRLEVIIENSSELFQSSSEDFSL